VFASAASEAAAPGSGSSSLPESLLLGAFDVVFEVEENGLTEGLFVEFLLLRGFAIVEEDDLTEGLFVIVEEDVVDDDDDDETVALLAGFDNFDDEADVLFARGDSFGTGAAFAAEDVVAAAAGEDDNFFLPNLPASLFLLPFPKAAAAALAVLVVTYNDVVDVDFFVTDSFNFFVAVLLPTLLLLLLLLGLEGLFDDGE